MGRFFQRVQQGIDNVSRFLWRLTNIDGDWIEHKIVILEIKTQSIKLYLRDINECIKN